MNDAIADRNATWAGKYDTPLPGMDDTYYTYHMSRTGGGGDSGDKSTDGSPRGGGRGGGGAGRPARRPLRLVAYRQTGYNASPALRRQAGTQADARNREGFTANQRMRNSANTRYTSAIRELALQQQMDEAKNRANAMEALSANNNMALNRGMGFGQGAMAVQGRTRLGFENALQDTLRQYAMQRDNRLDERNQIYTDMDEQDRLLRANRLALMEELFNELDDRAYGRYMSNEGLRQTETDSENARRTALYNSLYG